MRNRGFLVGVTFGLGIVAVLWALSLPEVHAWGRSLSRALGYPGLRIVAEVSTGLSILLLATASWLWVRARRQARFLGRQLAYHGAALAREREFSQMVLEGSRDAFLAWDHEGRIVEASKSARHIFGWEASELRGMPLRSLLDPRHHADYDRFVEAAKAGRTTGTLDRLVTLKGQRRDGSSFLFEMAPFEARLGDRLVVGAMLRDVTARVRLEQEKRRSDSLRVLLEELPDAVMVHRSQRLVYVNRRFLDSLGFESAEEVLGRPVQEFVHPHDWERVEGRLRQLEATGKAVERAEERFCGPGGADVTWEVAKVPVVFDGRPAVVALGRDVTGRRLAERRLRQVVESAPSGMLMTDLEGRIVLVNRQVARMFGYSERELLGQPVEMLVPERLRGAHPVLRREYVTKPAARPMGKGRDLYGLHADGSEVPVEIGLNPLRTDEGLFVLCSVVDISERRRAEGLIQVADRLATVGTLAAGVAHGINNPLSYVKGNVVYAQQELGERGTPAPPLEESEVLDELRLALEHAAEGADRIRDIVADLLTFARQESDSESDAGADPREVLESVLQMTANELWPRARVERDFGPVPWVRGDSSRLAHAFTNLLVNAAHALPEGAADRHVVSVSTRTDPESGWAVVEIEDTGEGMPEEVLKRAFEPFYTTKEVGQGTGLGLSVTHGIVTEVGGRIEIETEPGKGTLVRVALPPARRPVREDPASPPLRRPARVLVVDDEPRVLEMFGRLLRRDEVVVATDGATALERIRAGERFDVIFCDVIMPGRSGPGVYDELVARCPAQAERMVFMTGGAFTAEARAFLERVPNRCLHKPPDLAELESAIAAILHGDGEPTPTE